MEIVRVKPSGYCFGVVNAINLVLKTLKNDAPKPITIYGMLIHNKHVIESLSHLGVHTLMNPNIDDLKNLKGTIIFTAHGIKQSVIDEALRVGLHVVNATCKDVTRTIDLIKENIRNGYHVLYIGKKGHPEATASTDYDSVQLITKIEDLDIDPNQKYLITNQTTMSMLDVMDIYEYVKNNHPNVEVMDEICNATRRRQEAVLEHLDKDLLIVVGDKKSNNSNNLAKLHPNGVLVESFNDLIDVNLDVNTIAITAGASTPKMIVDDVENYIRNYPNNSEFTPQTNIKEIVKLK